MPWSLEVRARWETTMTRGPRCAATCVLLVRDSHRAGPSDWLGPWGLTPRRECACKGGGGRSWSWILPKLLQFSELAPGALLLLGLCTCCFSSVLSLSETLMYPLAPGLAARSSRSLPVLPGQSGPSLDLPGVSIVPHGSGSFRPVLSQPGSSFVTTTVHSSRTGTGLLLLCSPSTWHHAWHLVDAQYTSD